jgi:Carboxypeptidase regulatory-like domain
LKTVKSLREDDGCHRVRLSNWPATGVLIFGLLLSATVARSQQTTRAATASKPAAQTYRIAGTLTNSVTGEAISGATMTLFAEPTRQVLQTTVTDTDGHFALEPVVAAKYSLSAARRGYMSANFDEHEQWSSAIVTGEDQDTEHIPFRLNPGAMVRGVVTDDGGDPVTQANVLLMRKTRNGGMGEHLVKSISGDTDDTGLFEFWNLLPGTYFLAVKANPWYALHPFLSEKNEAASEQVREDVAALDVAYPVTYFSGSTEDADATPISVGSGERVQADVTLHAVPAIHLTIHAARGNTGQENVNPPPVVHETIFGSQDFPSFARGRSGAEGSAPTEFVDVVAPGHYSVSQPDPPRVVEIDATGSTDIDLSSGARVSSVDVKVQMADGSAPPRPLELMLIADDASLRQLPTRTVVKSEARFDEVPPGKWFVAAQSQGLQIAAVLIQSNGESRADGRIVVKDQPLSVRTVLAVGKTDVEGFAKKNGKGEPGVMVVLVTKDPEGNPDLFRRDQSDSDGSFLLKNVLPGNYKILAIEDGWDLDWARPEVFSRYLQRGTSVTVSSSAGALIQLAEPVAVQVR